MTAPGKIRVRVTATQEVTYNQVVEMTPEEWAKVEAAYEAGDDAALDALAEIWIDTYHVDDARDLEDTNFSRLKDGPVEVSRER